MLQARVTGIRDLEFDGIMPGCWVILCPVTILDSRTIFLSSQRRERSVSVYTHVCKCKQLKRTNTRKSVTVTLISVLCPPLSSAQLKRSINRLLVRPRVLKKVNAGSKPVSCKENQTKRQIQIQVTTFVCSFWHKLRAAPCVFMTAGRNPGCTLALMAFRSLHQHLQSSAPRRSLTSPGRTPHAFHPTAHCTHATHARGNLVDMASNLFSSLECIKFFHSMHVHAVPRQG